jgi:S-methylmethionine-dependent homocysteine/selenocysteine methylase
VIGRAIAEARQVLPETVEVGGYANRFEPGADEPPAANEAVRGLRADLSPGRYATTVGWIADGASIVGGCCGITPDHVAAIAHRRRVA